MKLHINTSNLLSWFDRQKRDYPWGRNKTPYLVWISEIMLQQTVAASVIPYFKKWCHDYPDIHTLAAADLNEVLSHWEGLGYYSRCRNLHKAANKLVEINKGELPATYKELISIPGIGDYTARAILSIAFQEPYAVLDANVRRIAQRLTARKEWSKELDKEILTDLEKSIPPDRPGDFNEAMMQLGQQICTSSSPKCNKCPLADDCMGLKKNIAEEIPVKVKKKINKTEKEGIIIIENGRMLLRKKKRGLFHDLWLFPLIESNDRQFLKDLGITYPYRESFKLKKRNHFYTDNNDAIIPYVFHVKHKDQISVLPQNNEDYEYKWIKLENLEEYPSPSVYRKIITESKETWS